ncbi:MAG TPA: zinc ribbon domain-containing protein, partial [Dehalococcoidia bacterium]|nr:zinc ribbon domain-containing protein [Dehalococcoidia bacterium]
MTTKSNRRVPIEPGYFTVPENPNEAPRLLGSRCRACGEHFFPRRVVCAKCLARDIEDVELSPRGKLYTWTHVFVPMFGAQRTDLNEYDVGQVDLPEGVRVQTTLTGDTSKLRIGGEMEICLETLRQDDE